VVRRRKGSTVVGSLGVIENEGILEDSSNVESCRREMGGSSGKKEQRDD
jgi:hypothetical protein